MKIEDWRIKIDEVEKELISLINRRAEYALQIGALKRKLNLDIFDPNREREILERISQTNPGPIPNDSLINIFKTIIHETREFEARHTHDLKS
jgi:chorismate mutase